MSLTARPLTESEARLVLSWRYPAPYDVYNLPPWEDSVRHGFGITQSALREREFFAVCRGDAFIGWFRLKPSGDGVLLGVGLAPERCGCGLGPSVMRLAIKTCSALYGPVPLRLEVRAFNRRAVRCYEQAGFREAGRLQKDTPSGPADFLLMEYCTLSQPSSRR